MNRPVHVELRPLDTRRARTFWSRAFGWSFAEASGPVAYWSAHTGDEGVDGVHGGLTPSTDGQPGVVPWIEVEDIEEAVQRITDLGGQLRTPRMSIPGLGELAYCADPDGIQFAVVRRADKGP